MTAHDELPELVHGRTWQEMPVGFAFRTARRTLFESDVRVFINTIGITEPLFNDAETAGEAGYAGTLVPGMMTFAVAEGLVFQTGCTHRTGIAFLHADVDIKGPVYVGNTLGVTVEVTEQHATTSGGRGLITTQNIVVNQRGEAVMEYSPVRLTRGS
jgi:acyl dehydratase